MSNYNFSNVQFQHFICTPSSPQPLPRFASKHTLSTANFHPHLSTALYLPLLFFLYHENFPHRYTIFFSLHWIAMKYSIFALLSGVSARFIELTEVDNVILRPDELSSEKYHIELAPGDTRWVTEDEKWELRRVCYQY